MLTLPCNFAGALYPKVCLRLVQCTGHVQADAFNEASNLGLFALFGFRFLYNVIQLGYFSPQGQTFSLRYR